MDSGLHPRRGAHRGRRARPHRPHRHRGGLMTQMTQQAPYPDALAEIVSNLEYRPGWTFTLTDRDRGQGSVGLTFNVLAQVKDSVGGVYQGVDRGDKIIVSHQFIVPAAAYNHASWMRWVLNRILDVEQH